MFFFINGDDPVVEENRKELLTKVKEINGKTIGQIDATHYLTNPKNKGRIGQVIQIYLGKNPDTDPNADFPEAKLELKATGLLSSKTKDDAFRAKERLVLHEINYVKDHGISFEDSGLLNKCASMLVTCYEYIPAEKKGEHPEYSKFPVIDSFIYTLSDEDMAVMKNDYDTILAKINSGHAETISESDTNYLAACTKAADSTKRRDQYGSAIKAKPRAFSLKQSFLSAIIRKYISDDEYEQLAVVNNKEPLEDSIIKKLEPFYGYTKTELSEMFPDVNKESKSAFASYVARMVNAKDLNKTDEFLKANIHIKTVRVEEDGHIREDMSFGLIDFMDVAATKWEDSKWHAYFDGARFFFPVFKKKHNDYVFEKAVFYSLPEMVTDGFIKYTYERTSDILNSGNVITKVITVRKKDGKAMVIHENNFVGKSENFVSHVRPKGTNFEKSRKPIPVKDVLTGEESYGSQCLWLDRHYIQAILENRADDYLMQSDEKMKKQGHPIDFDL
jgi:DNA mismatch repair protein MutH